MLKERRLTVRETQADMKQAEIDAESSQLAIATLISRTIARRRELNLDPLITRDAVASCNSALACATDTFSHLATAHAHFRDILPRIGLDPVSFGDLDGCPPKKGEAADPVPVERFRVVANG